jgi:hypothetical protein
MKRVFASIVVVASFMGAASAETMKIPDGQVEIWYPEKWNLERANGVISVSAPSDEAALMFMTIPGEKLDEAMKALDGEINKLATDVQVAGSKETSLNGMKVFVADATGKVKGRRCEISAALVVRPNKKLVLVLGIVQSDKRKVYERELAKVVTSMRPL